MNDPDPLPPNLASEHDSDASGKQLHIAGAGTTGMAILIVSLSMLFLASMAAYIIIRMQTELRLRAAGIPVTWPPPGTPPVPNTLWISTIVILLTSITIQMALNAIRRDDRKAVLRNLVITSALGLLFLALQTLNWWEFYKALDPGTTIGGAYLGMFYVLTGLHAAHVIGGLIPLAIVTHGAAIGKYSRNFYPGIRYSAIYWHFLDAIWVVLFCVIYF